MSTSTASFRLALAALASTWAWAPEGVAAPSHSSVECRPAPGAEEIAQALCAAVAARLVPHAPPVIVELLSSRPHAISARLGKVRGGDKDWGMPVTLDVVDRDSLPAAAVARLAAALLKLAAEDRPAPALPPPRP